MSSLLEKTNLINTTFSKIFNIIIKKILINGVQKQHMDINSIFDTNLNNHLDRPKI